MFVKTFFVSGASDSFDNMERKRAFLHEADINDVNVECFSGNFTEKSGYEIAKTIIAARNIPEAVFCANDQMAIGFLRAMKENHLRAPDDITIVGFDDIQVAKYMQPTLSTIGASRLSWGALAAAQLIDFLEDEKPFQAIRIPTRLIQRESSSKNLVGDLAIPHEPVA